MKNKRTFWILMFWLLLLITGFGFSLSAIGVFSFWPSIIINGSAWLFWLIALLVWRIKLKKSY